MTTETAEMTELEIRRVAAALKTAARLSGVSLRRIERAVGMCPGYLSRIFAGRAELRVRHVLEVCRAIGLPTDSFFQAVFPRRRGSQDEAVLVEKGLRELHPPPYSVPLHGIVTTPNPVPGALGPGTKADRLLHRLRQVLVDIEQNGV